jgi:hypothetical protein
MAGSNVEKPNRPLRETLPKHPYSVYLLSFVELTLLYKMSLFLSEPVTMMNGNM